MVESVEALIQLNPSSPWLRLDIAGVVLHDKPRAVRIGDGRLELKDAPDPEMKFAYTLYLAQSF